MTKVIASSLLLTVLVGCSSTRGLTIPSAVAGIQRIYAAAILKGSPESAVLAQLQTFVASQHPGTTLVVDPEAGWKEMHQTDIPNQMQFDVLTTVQTAASLPSKQAEFYGRYDTATGHLVPQTLWVGAETEATFNWLRPSR
jgi:hypothetical protein